jgi:hypothetical protein
MAAADTKRDGDFAGCQVPVCPHHRTPRQRRPTNEGRQLGGLTFSEQLPFSRSRCIGQFGLQAYLLRDQTEKHTARADVFRYAPKNGHWFATLQNIARIERYGIVEGDTDYSVAST